MSNVQRPIDLSRNNRLQLGLFLRSRRESLDAAALGLPRIRHRRTPGLRREEVAQLADVGVTWYTWLEQGREINPSTRTLAAIAQALQCNEAETLHLFRLAGQHDPAPSVVKACSRISPHSQHLLDALDPLPAIIQSARFDVIGWNQAWCRVMNIDLQTIAPEDRNCMLLAFTHEGWCNALADRSEQMNTMVALFRTQMAENLNDPLWEALLARLLSQSEAFRELWHQGYEIRAINNHVKRFNHPQFGILTLHQNNWWSTPRNGDRLLVYTAEDAESAAALQQLAAQSQASART